MQLVYEKFNLTKMLHQLKLLVESKINEKNIHYIEDINIKHEWFIGDELRLNQVLVNFLSNAIKYCNKDGNIKLIVSEQVIENSNVQLAFAVQDDGIGIAKDKQELIFQSFEQADNSEIARKQGTGLGLAICTRIVHMMGWILSQKVNLEKVVSLALLLIYKLLMMSMLNRDDCKYISIYAMSANAFDEDVKCSLASGMNGHLSEPIDRVKLKEVLVKCLNKQGGLPIFNMLEISVLYKVYTHQ